VSESAKIGVAKDMVPSNATDKRDFFTRVFPNYRYNISKRKMACKSRPMFPKVIPTMPIIPLWAFPVAPASPSPAFHWKPSALLEYLGY
jgi:hypothetical protein